MILLCYSIAYFKADWGWGIQKKGREKESNPQSLSQSNHQNSRQHLHSDCLNRIKGLAGYSFWLAWQGERLQRWPPQMVVDVMELGTEAASNTSISELSKRARNTQPSQLPVTNPKHPRKPETVSVALINSFLLSSSTNLSAHGCSEFQCVSLGHLCSHLAWPPGQRFVTTVLTVWPQTWNEPPGQ